MDCFKLGKRKEAAEEVKNPVLISMAESSHTSCKGTPASKLFDEAKTTTQVTFSKLLEDAREEIDGIRCPSSNRNILHHVLNIGRTDLACIVVERASTVLLLQECDVTVATIKGKKNALHFATELKDVKLAQMILEKITDSTSKMELLQQATPKDFEGQRPRKLPACHLAAFIGCKDLVVLYLDHGVLVNALNSEKDTALLWAARWNHLDVVEELLKRNADTNVKNVNGFTALYWAIHYGYTETVKLLVKKSKCDVNKTREVEPVSPILAAGADPNVIRGKECLIHHAAEKGHADIVEYFLKNGALIDEADEEGDTALLHAARHGHTHCLQVLLEWGDNHSHKNHMGDNSLEVTIDAQNKKGNTALHEACRFGHKKSIDALMANKATASIRNKRGETALHVAAYCRSIHPETVNKLMHYVIDSHPMGSLNIMDNDENSPLHIAAQYARPEVIWEFRHVSFNLKNADGNIALHKAVRKDEPEALTKMLDVYKDKKKDGDINEQNNNMETVLHLAAKEGFKEHVNRLVLFGADLIKQDKDKNTVLHLLAKLSADYPQRAKTYLAVFEEILEQATLWWCMRNDQTHGDEETRKAVMPLLTETYNKAGLNVIGQACRVGAADIVKLILSKRGVMCFQCKEGMEYDVTNMTPLTNNSVTGCCAKGPGVQRQSYIELLLSLENAEMASKVLDVQPFREIEDAYSVTTAWIYSLVMLVHIAYMSLLSYYGIQLLEERRKNPNDDSFTTAKIILYAVVPLEPAVIVIYNMYSMAKGSCAGAVSLIVVKQSFPKIMRRLFNRILPFAFGVIYSVLVIVWIVLYRIDYTNMDYFLSVAVCMGWLYTTHFTRGFRLINYFWRMIQQMIIEDILKFLFVYLFVLLAFSFAIHAVFQISTLQTDVYSSAWDTMFLVFNLMIGMGNLFDDTLDTNMSAVGRHTTYLKVMYLAYIVLSTILLLNLLIAMMNDSYSAILKQHSVDWRIESVQFGVDIENVFPWSTQVFSRIHLWNGASRKRQEPEKNNEHLQEKGWYITVRTKKIKEDGAEETEIDTLRDVQLQIKHDLDDLRSLLRELKHSKATLLTERTSLAETVA